ncbi:MAG: penicillin acylase family protein [Archangium sp.]|nr:penicillin acylase family protein [Archangium sp.]
MRMQSKRASVHPERSRVTRAPGGPSTPLGVNGSLLIIALLFPGCAATSLLGYKIAPDYPDDGAKESMALPGLTAPVTVLFDAQGVPHLEAQNLADLARTSGFVQGRARFFQMDLMRRLARGRLSELIGEQPLAAATTVEYDKTMRGWRIEARATKSYELLAPEQKALAVAFSEGVNAAMTRWKPLEYRLVGVEPEPWRPEDCLAVGLLNVWSITHNYQQEATRLLLAMSVGLERMDAIYPAEPLAGGGRTLAALGPLSPLPPSVAKELEELFPLKTAEADTRFIGNATIDVLTFAGASNAWAVNGERTQSGKPMVANDPHLSHLLPGLLLQLHLKAPGLDVIGVTVPGVPWVLGGHNADVAWGMTSTMTDVVDLVIEKEDPSRPGFVLHEGGDCALTTREEVVRVRDGAVFLEKRLPLRETCNGPLYNDLHPELFPPGSPLVAIRWKVEGVERSFEVLLELDRAKSVEDVGRAVAKLPSTWNTWTVADAQGHLASYPSGAVPVRPNHRGTFPVPGWVGKYEWQTFASGDRLPHIVDPPEGLVAHANNLTTDPGNSAFERIQVDSAPPFRFERIVGLARATAKHDLASFKRMLTDTHSLRAQTVVPSMLASLGDGAGFSPDEQKALALLRAWNFDAKADRPEAAIFFSTYQHAVVTAIGDELPAPAVKFFLGQRYSTNTSDLWFERDAHVVWDDRRTPAVETRKDVVRAAFVAAIAELTRTLGPDVAAWKWGTLHWHKPQHAFGGRSALDGTVNLPKMEAGGELDSIWKTHFDLGNEKAPFKVVAGPVMRSVVDLATPKRGWWIVDTGASGWPLAPHYGDQYEQWRSGELVPMEMDLEVIKSGPHGALTLTPLSSRP